MVRGLIFLQFLLLLLMLLSVSTARSESDSSLRIIVDKTQLEMGKYLSIRIVYIGNDVPDSINLQKWDKDFFVDRRGIETSEAIANQLQTTEYLRLYPRSAGNKVLYSLASGGAISSPVNIKVITSVRNGVNGTPQWQPLPESIWQGETIKISIIQDLMHPSNEVIVDNVLFPGFTVQQLKPDYIKQNKVEKLRLNWLISAQSPGYYQLDAGAITQRGRGRWRFYLPYSRIKIKPLAAYIPPTVPVGQLSMETGLFYKENKAYWFVELKNKGQLAADIYGVATQLSKLTGLAIDLIILIIPESEPDMPFQTTHRYQLPVPDWTWGFTREAEIHVPYFDVREGKLKTVSQKLPAVWQIPKAGKIVFFFLLLLVFLLALFVLYKGIKNILAWRHYRRLVKQTQTPLQLRQLLLTQGNFSTLEEWSKNDRSLKKLTLAKNIAGQLNALCYARSGSVIELSLEEIKQLLIKLLSPF